MTHTNSKNQLFKSLLIPVLAWLAFGLHYFQINMPNYKAVLLFSFLMFLGEYAFSQKATDDFSGKWKTEEGATVEISKKETGFTGIGTINKKTIVKDLQFKEGNWVSEITNPIKNVTANAIFLLEGNRIKIVAKKGFFSKTIYWSKL